MIEGKITFEGETASGRKWAKLTDFGTGSESDTGGETLAELFENAFEWFQIDVEPGTFPAEATIEDIADIVAAMPHVDISIYMKVGK